MRGKRIDRVGLKFGRILILARVPRPETAKTRTVYYWCRCDCGTEKRMSAMTILGGMKKYGDLSCGCLKKERGRINLTTHGLTGTARYMLWSGAKTRAMRSDVAFEITIEDIPEIPEICPLLGSPLFKNGKTHSANSPSLDRIDSRFGYLKWNIHVISRRANVIKNNASVEEFELILKNWKALLPDEI